jgi:deoxycytidylate deaminase
MKKHFVFIQAAIECALKSNMFHRHGSVIVKRNRIIGSGYNMMLKRPKHHQYSTHAEVSAIEDAKQRGHDFHGTRMYVIRLMRGSSHSEKCLRLRNSLPCCHCSRFINAHNILRVFFTCDESHGYEFRRSTSRTKHSV